MGSTLPSCPCPMGRTSGSSRCRPPRITKVFLGILSWASAPLQRLPKHPAAALSSRFPKKLATLRRAERQPAAPPLRSRSLQRFPCSEQRHSWSSIPSSTASAFRCSQPPGAFIRPEPAGLVPCRIRSWDHPPEPCSSRAAARCFQRRSPLGVPTAFRVFLRVRVRHSTQRFRLTPSA
jgi:hypothetical protein